MCEPLWGAGANVSHTVEVVLIVSGEVQENPLGDGKPDCLQNWDSCVCPEGLGTATATSAVIEGEK